MYICSRFHCDVNELSNLAGRADLIGHSINQQSILKLRNSNRCRKFSPHNTDSWRDNHVPTTQNTHTMESLTQTGPATATRGTRKLNVCRISNVFATLPSRLNLLKFLPFADVLYYAKAIVVISKWCPRHYNTQTIGTNGIHGLCDCQSFKHRCASRTMADWWPRSHWS